MIISASIFATSPEPLDIALLILPQASILEVAATLDPMRSANRHLGYDAFRWRIVTPDGAAVPLTCDIELPSGGGLQAAVGADVLIVIAGFRQAEGATRPLIAALRRLAPRFRAIGGIDAGTWVLARAGLLDGHRATVHWEDLEDLASAHPAISVVPDRYVISGSRWTAGGAAPAADMMLQLIRSRHGAPLAMQVAASFIYDAARAGSEPQISLALPSITRSDDRVTAAMARFADTMEEPQTVAIVARLVGISTRRLEALFVQELGVGPGEFSLNLRLQAARRMMVDSRQSVNTVALRCGFGSQSAFSRAFRRRFGQTPTDARRKMG